MSFRGNAAGRAGGEQGDRPRPLRLRPHPVRGRRPGAPFNEIAVAVDSGVGLRRRGDLGRRVLRDFERLRAFLMRDFPASDTALMPRPITAKSAEDENERSRVEIPLAIGS